VTPPFSPERGLLLAGASLAAALYPGYRVESVAVRLTRQGGVSASLVVMNSRPDHSRLEGAMLDALRLAEEPLRSKAIAKVIGHKPDSYMREKLRNLVTAGEVVKLNGGYWLASRQQPQPQKRPRRSPASTETNNPEPKEL
jgi:hypothetical protein